MNPRGTEGKAEAAIADQSEGRMPGSVRWLAAIGRTWEGGGLREEEEEEKEEEKEEEFALEIVEG